jgi:hypothetical protein
VWYELAYIESLYGVKAAQRVWQLAFGSGFKFNSAVLVANRDIRTFHPAWDGFDANVSVVGEQQRIARQRCQKQQKQQQQQQCSRSKLGGAEHRVAQSKSV